MVDRLQLAIRKRMSRFAGHYALILVNTLICIFLLAPILIVVVTSFSRDQFMRFPPSGWSLRWYVQFYNSERLMGGLRLSATLGIATSAITMVLGTLAAFAIVNGRLRYANFIRSLHMAPLITPGVVTGLAILIYFGSLGFRGSFWTLLAGHVILTIPFVVMIVEASMQSFDRAVEEAAVSLGASRIVAFLTVTLPVLRTSIISATVFAFLYSFDELVVTLFLPAPLVQTLPVQMFNYIQFNLDPLPAAISTVLIAFALVIVSFASWLGGLGRIIGDR